MSEKGAGVLEERVVRRSDAEREPIDLVMIGCAPTEALEFLLSFVQLTDGVDHPHLPGDPVAPTD